jgi:hypothetical protein
MEIRVGQPGYPPAGGAGGTRFLIGLRAERELGEPQTEPLLADALVTREEHDLGQSVGAQRLGEVGAERSMAEDRMQTHGEQSSEVGGCFEPGQDHPNRCIQRI